jgi:hypothetical protein
LRGDQDPQHLRHRASSRSLNIAVCRISVPSQGVPLVQRIERPPVLSTSAPLIVLTLPKAKAVVETVQLAVTVAVTLIVELAVAAIAVPGAARAAAKIVAPAAMAPERGMLNIVWSFLHHCRAPHQDRRESRFDSTERLVTAGPDLRLIPGPG